LVPWQRADAQVTAGLPGVGGLSLDFPAAITLIRHATTIPTGTIGDRTTLIHSHIRIITVATDTPRTTASSYHRHHRHGYHYRY